jgi:tryptophan 2,3-dioxygenase
MQHDVTTAWEPHEATQDKLIWLHVNDPEASMVGEALVDLDEGLQEWRYRHVKMVERTIGRKMGSGGSAGAGYLASTLFNPVFPDLWAIRSRF